MTESTKDRALNLFAAMGTIPDEYVTSAEEALYEAEAGIYRPAKPMGPFRRFLNSGWGAAVISGIVALTVLFLIIRAGQNPPTYQPPAPPSGSTIEMSDEGVNFTIATEQANYPEGINRFTVVMTGKTKGEKIAYADNWHLERLTDGGAEAVVGLYHTDDYREITPAKDEYATLTKTLNVNGALEAGTYRLHATKHDGEKYVSVAWCEFTVGEVSADEVNFTIAPRSPSYPKWTHNFSVILTGPTVEKSLSAVDGWYLERLTAEGKEKIGTPYVNTAFETAKDENSIKISLGVPVDLNSGRYQLHAFKQDGDKNISLATCFFTVTDEAMPSEFRFHPTPTSTAPYTISVPDIPYGADSLTITVTATEPGVSLIDPPLHWFVGKVADGVWPYDDDLFPWVASATEIEEVLPSENTGGYAQFTVTLTFRYPPEWTPGQYYLYAMTEPLREDNYLIDNCKFNVIEPPAHCE